MLYEDLNWLVDRCDWHDHTWQWDVFCCCDLFVALHDVMIFSYLYGILWRHSQDAILNVFSSEGFGSSHKQTVLTYSKGFDFDMCLIMLTWTWSLSKKILSYSKKYWHAIRKRHASSDDWKWVALWESVQCEICPTKTLPTTASILFQPPDETMIRFIVAEFISETRIRREDAVSVLSLGADIILYTSSY